MKTVEQCAAPDRHDVLRSPPQLVKVPGTIKIFREYDILTIGVVEFRSVVTLSMFELGQKTAEQSHPDDA